MNRYSNVLLKMARIISEGKGKHNPYYEKGVCLVASRLGPLLNDLPEEASDLFNYIFSPAGGKIAFKKVKGYFFSWNIDQNRNISERQADSDRVFALCLMAAMSDKDLKEIMNE